MNELLESKIKVGVANFRNWRGNETVNCRDLLRNFSNIWNIFHTYEWQC